MDDLTDIVTRLDDRIARRAPWRDIREDVPDVSDEDAYRVQFALMRRRSAEGDPVVGYKAAYTSVAVRAQRGNGGPIMGAFLASALRNEIDPIDIVTDSRNAVEAEVAILLKDDLARPDTSPLDVRRATAALLPAIEVAVGAPGNVDRSRQMVIATHKTAGSVILGGPGVSPDGIDLRLEGAVLFVNGEPKASATAVEVMGDPYVAAAFMARTAAANGEHLKAGMVLMTGSITAAVPVAAGDEVRAAFTRLGSVGIRFGR